MSPGIHPIRDPLRYGYAVGRVRVLESRMLGRSHFERLLDASDFAAQQRILSETVYGAVLEGAQTCEDVERALDVWLAELYDDFLETANLPEEIVNYFRVMYDYENIRGRLKAEVYGIPVADLVGPLGSISAEEFTAPTSELPPDLAKAESRLRELLLAEDGETLSADDIDCRVDDALQAELLRIADESSSRFLLLLARQTVDTGNVRAFVRARRSEAPHSEVARWFTPGGTIAPAELAALYRLPLAEAAERIALFPAFRGIDAEAIVDAQRFDTAMEGVAARRLHNARMVAIGPEPVLAYVMIRQAEVRAVRTLLIGKLSGVDTELLRTRIRDVA